MSTNRKCTVKDGSFVIPCERLDKASEYGNPRGKQKGIYAWNYYKFAATDPGPSRTMFGVKSGEYVQKGFLFNFCPFCGEQIDGPFAGQSDEQERANDAAIAKALGEGQS